MSIENPLAFPNPYYSNVPGMTLRDYFAGQALVALVAEPGDLTISDVTKDAYRIADAMLAARQKDQPNDR